MVPNHASYHICHTDPDLLLILVHCIDCHYAKSKRGHSFSMYAKFSEKLTFLIPWYAHNVSLLKNFAYVLNEWSKSKCICEPIF